jgi:hypothetical protein
MGLFWVRGFNYYMLKYFINKRTIFDESLKTLHLLSDCYQDCIRKSTVIGTFTIHATVKGKRQSIKRMHEDGLLLPRIRQKQEPLLG